MPARVIKHRTMKLSKRKGKGTHKHTINYKNKNKHLNTRRRHRHSKYVHWGGISRSHSGPNSRAASPAGSRPNSRDASPAGSRPNSRDASPAGSRPNSRDASPARRAPQEVYCEGIDPGDIGGKFSNNERFSYTMLGKKVIGDDGEDVDTIGLVDTRTLCIIGRLKDVLADDEEFVEVLEADGYEYKKKDWIIFRNDVKNSKRQHKKNLVSQKRLQDIDV